MLGSLHGAIGTHEEGGALVGGPIEAGDAEGIRCRDVLGDGGAHPVDQGVHGVAASAVLAVDHGADAVGGVGSGDAVGGESHLAEVKDVDELRVGPRRAPREDRLCGPGVMLGRTGQKVNLFR